MSYTKLIQLQQGISLLDDAGVIDKNFLSFCFIGFATILGMVVTFELLKAVNAAPWIWTMWFVSIAFCGTGFLFSVVAGLFEDN